MLSRLLPSKPYNGLTIFLSHPSRKDTARILTGEAGELLNDSLMKCNTTIWHTDCRLMSEYGAALLPETKGILILGEPGLHKLGYETYKLSELRGTPIKSVYGLPCIVSYTPQDACDPQNFEIKFNQYLKGEEEDEKKTKEDGKKRGGRIKRNNYRFWFGSDVAKILHRIRGGEIYDSNVFNIKIYPPAAEVFSILSTTIGDDFYFDIETDSERNLTVIGFSFGKSNDIYSLPILDYNYRLFYGAQTYRILWALVIALKHNRVVIHNSMFDLLVLLWKYKLLIFRDIYDTMYGQHRMFPEIEKGLGQSLSLHPQIWEEYHKDQGIFEPKNQDQQTGLLRYNARDVIALRLLLRAQAAAMDSTPGLRASIEQANKAIYPFLLNTLVGIEIDRSKRDKTLDENDKTLNQLIRVINTLTGPGVDLLPTSSPSCIKYFYNMLGYPVAGKTKTGGDSLDETNLLKLKLKNPDNIVIDFCIKYRGLVKESGGLKARQLPEYENE